MDMTKKFVAIAAISTLAGCASVPQVSMPAVTPNAKLAGKSVSYEVLYTQPILGNPWTTPADEYYKPSTIEEMLKISAEHDAYSYADEVLQSIPTILKQHIGSGAQSYTASNASDYVLKVYIKTDDKAGPTIPDRDLLRSFFPGFITLGFANGSYNMVADFDVKYSLVHQGQVLVSKQYDVLDSSPSYWRTDDFTDMDYDTAKKVFKRNIDKTLSEFLNELPANL